MDGFSLGATFANCLCESHTTKGTCNISSFIESNTGKNQLERVQCLRLVYLSKIMRTHERESSLGSTLSALLGSNLRGRPRNITLWGEHSAEVRIPGVAPTAGSMD